jgi:hypothetical protein
MLCLSDINAKEKRIKETWTIALNKAAHATGVGEHILAMHKNDAKAVEWIAK